MDPAIQTNLNGINTLTKNLNLLKDKLQVLFSRVESLNLDKTNETVSDLDKRVDLNSIRLATIRKSDFSNKIKKLSDVVDSLSTKLSKHTKKLDEQDKEIFDIKKTINVLLPLIESNKVSIEDVNNKTQHNLGAIGALSDIAVKLDVKADVVKDRLADTDEVVKGCIIGIDKNTSTLTENTIKIGNSILAISKNKSNIKENKEKIEVNSERISLNSSQTRANSRNIETMNLR